MLWLLVPLSGWVVCSHAERGNEGVVVVGAAERLGLAFPRGAWERGCVVVVVVPLSGWVVCSHAERGNEGVWPVFLFPRSAWEQGGQTLCVVNWQHATD